MGRPAKEYALTIDMAKEIVTVGRSERGRQARQYFLQGERIAVRALPSSATANQVDLREATLMRVIGQMVELKLASIPGYAVVDAISVRTIFDDDFKVPSTARRSLQRWVFNQLRSYCLAKGIKAQRRAHSGTWIFPRHDALVFCAGALRAPHS